MNKLFILDQLKNGPMTARDIATSYCNEKGGKYYSTLASTKRQLAVLAKQHYVQKIGTRDEEILTEQAVNAPHYSTIRMIVWGIVDA